MIQNWVSYSTEDLVESEMSVFVAQKDILSSPFLFPQQEIFFFS